MIAPMCVPGFGQDHPLIKGLRSMQKIDNHFFGRVAVSETAYTGIHPSTRVWLYGAAVR